MIGAKWGPPQYKYILRECEIINYSQGKKNKGIDLGKKNQKRKKEKGQKILFMYAFGSKNWKKGKKKKKK